MRLIFEDMFHSCVTCIIGIRVYFRQYFYSTYALIRSTINMATQIKIILYPNSQIIFTKLFKHAWKNCCRLNQTNLFHSSEKHGIHPYYDQSNFFLLRKRHVCWCSTFFEHVRKYYAASCWDDQPRISFSIVRICNVIGNRSSRIRSQMGCNIFGKSRTTGPVVLQVSETIGTKLELDLA